MDPCPSCPCNGAPACRPVSSPCGRCWTQSGRTCVCGRSHAAPTQQSSFAGEQCRGALAMRGADELQRWVCLAYSNGWQREVNERSRAPPPSGCSHHFSVTSTLFSGSYTPLRTLCTKTKSCPGSRLGRVTTRRVCRGRRRLQARARVNGRRART